MFKTTNKKGVSLVTVLLFMLVATIAGTATLKWLTSEDRSSANRMEMVEAMQASKAGLESARAWLSYNANDVGALIKQYLDNGKKPISLSTQITGIRNSKQNYSVWLTGADISNSTYKLKITSNGVSRNGNAKYSENSILNVNGLYQVSIPQQPSGSINYSDAFFGSVESVNMKLSSATINGDAKMNGNVSEVRDHLVVTGDLYTCGADNVVFSNLYVKGHIYSQKKFTADGDVYVGEVFHPSQNGSGYGVTANNFYAEKGIDMNSISFSTVCPGGGPYDIFSSGAGGLNASMHVLNNLTINNGNLTTNSENAWGNQTIVVENNFVIKNGGIVFPTNTYSSNQNAPESYIVRHNAYTKNSPTGLHPVLPQTVSFGTDKNDLVDLGTPIFEQDQGNPNYWQKNWGEIPNSWSGPNYQLKLQILGQYPSTISSTAEYEADNMYNQYGKSIVTDPSPGCGSTPHIEDPITFNDELLSHSNEYLHHKGNKGKCKGPKYDGTLWGSPQANDLWKWLEECYEEEDTEKLYKGEWLLIELSEPKYIVQDYPLGLEHKYIIISNFDTPSDAGGGGWTFAPTKEGAEVFIYAKKSVGFKTSNNFSSTENYNYFIFGIADLAFNQAEKFVMNGSIFMSDCSKMSSRNTIQVDFDQNMVNRLNEASILCPKTGCSAGSSTDDDGGSSDSPYESGKDHYFIANSPQLDISLESQSKNTEAILDDNDNTKESLEPSVIVLPRVAYITKNPIGTLSDYFSVLNLNHATEEKDFSKVSCSPSLNATGSLYTEGHELTAPIYRCEYRSSYNTVPFWVYVSGVTGETPYVGLVADQVTIKGGETGTTVTLHVDEATRGGDMSVIIRVSEIPDRWSITPRSANITPLTFSSVNPNEHYYKVTFSTDGNIPLFDVSAEAGATSKTVIFELMPGTNEGCNIGSYKIEAISIPGVAQVHRSDIPETYCASNAELTTTTGKTVNCTEFVNRPNCTLDMQKNDVWIVPSCMSPKTIDGKDNELWSCNTNLPISLTPYTASDYCEIVVPNMTVESPQGDRETPYELYASLKRKPFTISIDVKGATGGVTTKVSRAFGGATPEEIVCKTEDGKKLCQVYAGDKVSIEKNDGSNTFNQWKCLEGDCMDIPSRTDAIFSLTVTQNSSVQLTYNRVDEHCFYESFDDRKSETTGNIESFEIFCPSEGYRNCIDIPTSYANRCTNCNSWSIENGQNAYEGSNASAVWAMMHWTTKHTRDYEYNKPVHSTSDKSLSVSGKHDAGTVLLNTVKAGANGQFTLTAKIPLRLGSLGATSSKNDGIILRSNSEASDYLLVSMIRETAGAGVAVYHILDGSSSKIQEKNFAGFLESVLSIFKNIENITLQATIQDNSLKVEVYYNKGDGTSIYGGMAELDLSSVAYMSNKNTYNRVGIRMYDNGTFATSKYMYYSAAWNSFDFAADCWETPQLYCSFANNYLGGMVPKDENVTPWFSYGSWFTSRGCEDVDFYYNGCDLDNSLYSGGVQKNGCTRTNTDGSPYSKGTLLNGSTFNFSDESPHGIPQNSLTRHGYKKSASAEISCKGETYSVNCGTFIVGTIENCSENYTLFSGTRSINNSSVTIDFRETAKIVAANLRDAIISVNVEKISEEGELKFKLIDAENTESSISPAAMTATKAYEYDIKYLADKVGFDPQKVTQIVFTGTGEFKILSILSDCNHVLSLKNCNATYTGSNFRISYTLKNAEAADKNGCSLESEIGNDVQNCPISGEGVFEISAPEDLFSTSGIQESKTIDFNITAKDKVGNEVACSPQPSVTIAQPELDCKVNSTSAFDGQGAPPFLYAISNCSGSMCNATVSVDNGTPKSVNYKRWCSDLADCSYESWTPTNLAVGEHTYKINHSVLGSCTKTIKIEETVAATASRCRVVDGEDGKEFRADITVPNYGTSILKLYYTDPIGNLLGGEVPVSAGDETSEFVQSLKDLPDGNYRLALFVNDNEKPACDPVTYVVNSKPSITIGSCSDFEKDGADGLIQITLNDVNGCGANDCTWEVSPSVNEGNGDLTDSKISFYDVNATETKSYEVTVSRPGYNSASCSFSVSLAQTSTDDCHCTCPTGCDNVITTGWNPSNKTACYFTDPRNATQLNGNQWDVAVHFYNDGEKANINGVEFSRNTPACQNGSTINCLGNASTGSVRIYQWTEDQLIDGGIYFQVTEGAQSIGSEAIKFNSGTRKCNLGVGSNAGSTGGGSGSGSTSDNIKETMYVETKISTAGHYIINGCAGGNATHTSTSKNAEIQVNFKRADGNYTASAKDCENFFGSSYRSNVYGYWANGDNECSAAFKVDYPLTLDLPEGIVYTLNKCY